MLMKKILNVSEMKQVRGGAHTSSLCAPGEKLYTCSTLWNGGTITKGSVCATNQSTAKEAVKQVHTDQLVESDQGAVVCY